MTIPLYTTQRHDLTMTSNQVCLGLADIRTNPTTTKNANVSVCTYVSTICAHDTYAKQRVYTRYAQEFFQHARDAGYTVADAYARTIAFATLMLMRYKFGVLMLDNGGHEVSEYDATIADMLAFTRACGGRL